MKMIVGETFHANLKSAATRREVSPNHLLWQMEFTIRASWRCENLLG